MPGKFAGMRSAVAALGLMLLAPLSPGHAQAPALGTVAGFAVLGGSTVTNTGPTVITGTARMPGEPRRQPRQRDHRVILPPGILTAPGRRSISTMRAIQAQIDLTTAYNNLVGRTDHDRPDRVTTWAAERLYRASTTSARWPN